MRTIESAGVEMFEKDLTFNTQLPYGTTSLVLGYAKQGPVDELINVTSSDELESIYGTPDNAAERYFYQTAKQVLNANGNLLCTRLPYGSGSGDGYVNNYSVLLYPIFPYVNTTEALSASEITIAASGFDLFDYSNFSGVDFSRTSNFYVASSLGMTSLSSLTLEYGIYTAASAIQLTPTSVANQLSGAFSTAKWIANISQGTNDIGLNNVDNWVVALSTNSIQASINISVSAGFKYNKVTDIGPVSEFTHNAAKNYYVGEPSHITITEAEYLLWEQGGIDWENTLTTAMLPLTGADQVGNAGLVIVNKAKTAIDDLFAGYYVAIADNSKTDRGSNFDSIIGAKSNGKYNHDEPTDWSDLNTSILNFSLTGDYHGKSRSISEVVETVPSWDFQNTGKGGYTDSLILTQFKFRPSIYNAEERKLNDVLYEAYIGSLDSTRQIQNSRGGGASNFFLEDVVNNSSLNMKVWVNPWISGKRGSSIWIDPVSGDPVKAVRVMSEAKNNTGTETSDVLSVNPAEPNGTAVGVMDAYLKAKALSNADYIYGIGEYRSCSFEESKYIGDVPFKLERALRLAENREQLRLDLVPDGGLSTIWTGMRLDMDNWPTNTFSAVDSDQDRQIFDDTKYVDGILNAHTFDRDSNGLLDQTSGSASEANDLWETIYNLFNNFCESTRKDCLHISDPLRYIFVQGNGDMKVMNNKQLNFSQHIYWPLKNLYGAANSSYACTYANWFKVYDKFSGNFVWAPPSGFINNLMIKTDTNFFPWYAPAGLTRGILRDVVDIGVNPSQKQRDLLYKIGINPTVYWPGDGYVVWGQKTLLQKPSAFDRINVRRLFLWLEKAVLPIARYFVFEQNTIYTRQRLKTAIDPVFAFAKSNEGVYDYLLVCDERNNTSETIDRNELIVDAYIKPVRVAEFILINFIATRTGQNFEELI